MNENEIKEYLKTNLSDYRYCHSLRVAEEAKSLAKIYHLNEQKAYLTGLVHDVAHEFTQEDNEYWIKIGKLSKSCLDNSYKNILHSDIGALVAKNIFLFDDDMCQAIKYHTIGNINMNTFDKIIFIADKIGRNNLDDKIITIKDLAYKGDINQALIIYFKTLEESLKARNLTMHRGSIELVQHLKNNIKEE